MQQCTTVIYSNVVHDFLCLATWFRDTRLMVSSLWWVNLKLCHLARYVIYSVYWYCWFMSSGWKSSVRLKPRIPNEILVQLADFAFFCRFVTCQWFVNIFTRESIISIELFVYNYCRSRAPTAVITFQRLGDRQLWGLYYKLAVFEAKFLARLCCYLKDITRHGSYSEFRFTRKNLDLLIIQLTNLCRFLPPSPCLIWSLSKTAHFHRYLGLTRLSLGGRSRSSDPYLLFSISHLSATAYNPHLPYPVKYSNVWTKISQLLIIKKWPIFHIDHVETF